MAGQTRAKYKAGILRFFENLTFEKTLVAAAVQMVEDFLGRAIDETIRWRASVVGTPTAIALVANAPSGKARIALAATNEAETNCLDGGDVLNWIIGQGLVMEFVAAFHVLPTGTTTKISMGLSAAYNATLASVAEYLWFQATSSGLINVLTSDGTLTQAAVSTGVTITADSEHVFCIDASDPTNVLFYIDGNQVCESTVFNLSTSPTLGLQPAFRVDKGANTNVGTVDVDSVRLYQRRAA